MSTLPLLRWFQLALQRSDTVGPVAMAVAVGMVTRVESGDVLALIITRQPERELRDWIVGVERGG